MGRAFSCFERRHDLDTTAHRRQEPVHTQCIDLPSICSICQETLGPNAGNAVPEKEQGLIVKLACGHAYHGLTCLGPHIGSKCAQMQQRLKEGLEQRFAEIQLDEHTRSELLGGGNFNTLHEQGRLRQCPSCGYGPVINTHCADMRSHDSARGSDAQPDRSTNECPTCGFFAASWSGWKAWDPEDMMSAVRCPDCRGPCSLAEDCKPLVQEHLQKLVLAESLHKARRHELLGLGYEISDVLMLLLTLQTRDQSPEVPAGAEYEDDFSRLPSQLMDMAECPQEAMAILSPLFSLFRAHVGGSLTSLETSVQVGVESIAEAPSALDGIATAIHAVRELLRKEERFDVVRRRGDLMLCMAISEEMKPALDLAVQSLSSQHPALRTDLMSLGWTDDGFQTIPRLHLVLHILESHLPVWSHPSSSPTLFVPAVVQEVGVQTDSVQTESVQTESVGQPAFTSLPLDDILSVARNCIRALASDASTSAAAECKNRRHMAALLRGMVEGKLSGITASGLGRPGPDRGYEEPRMHLRAMHHLLQRRVREDVDNIAMLLDHLLRETRHRVLQFQLATNPQELEFIQQLGALQERLRRGMRRGHRQRRPTRLRMLMEMREQADGDEPVDPGLMMERVDMYEMMMERERMQALYGFYEIEHLERDRAHRRAAAGDDGSQSRGDAGAPVEDQDDVTELIWECAKVLMQRVLSSHASVLSPPADGRA